MSRLLKLFQDLLFIILLQSLDIININYINFITFIVRSEARFIYISVDYFTRYLFADVISFAIFENNKLHLKENFDSKLKK